MGSFLEDVQAGLSASPKTLPSKYLYDEIGSALFEQITSLPEYYPTRMETALLTEIAPDLSAAIPAGAALVEFGSGSSIKTRLLLAAAPQLAVYAPLDISPSALAEAAARTAAEFPLLLVEPIVGDFTLPFVPPCAARGRACVGFFPGSTIGNFAPHEAVKFLRSARESLGPGARFIVGYDLVKSTETLIAAYDDAQGVTGAFNLNLLTRINRELGSAFNPPSFKHQARWNAEESRIEMHLACTRDLSVRVGNRQIDFSAGETIRTETSYKYTEAGFATLAEEAGWRVDMRWTSPPPSFGVALLAAG